MTFIEHHTCLQKATEAMEMEIHVSPMKCADSAAESCNGCTVLQKLNTHQSRINV